MDKHTFLKTLQKYRRGSITKEELQFIKSYYDLFQDEPDVLQALSEERKNEIKNEIKQKIWSGISENERHYPKTGHIYRRLFVITAAAAIFMAFFITVFILSKKIPDKQSTTLATPRSNAPLQREVTHNVVAQRDENRVLILPDGSTITLSPGSKLNYPSSFDGMKTRDVFLFGEAFFDIKHNRSKPFVVHTGQLKTVVLGTAFNIKALSSEAYITVTVKEGKVKVIDNKQTLGVITPNQQIIYDLKKIRSTLKTVENDSYLDWKEHDLLLDNLTIIEAAEILEERYKVKIIVSEQSLGSQRFTSTFKKNESLDQVLKSICVFNRVVYHYNKELATVIIRDSIQ